MYSMYFLYETCEREEREERRREYVHARTHYCLNGNFMVYMVHRLRKSFLCIGLLVHHVIFLSWCTWCTGQNPPPLEQISLEKIFWTLQCRS